ncbi:MAG: diaminopropionate ammonia-lyase [Proteobacteria bacterium]|nr:diaminopropionate ammonia-lyase [Pseudomonadota bacterium]
MFLPNHHPDYRQSLDPIDAKTLGAEAAAGVERILAIRPDHVPTPLHALPSLAAELGIGALHIKDESFRLGLGSFKALGGAYAVILLALEEAGRHLGRHVDIAEINAPEIRAITSAMTFACATDGNHGRSVAMGAGLVGARSSVFVHAGVSDERVAAIGRFGARMIRVEGTYDDSVLEAAQVATREGWTIVSDTSWPGYERIPGLVMQGYTAMMREALKDIPAPPTHVFVQAGVGGVAAAVAGHLAVVFGEKRPVFVVVEPARAACLFASAQAGNPVKIPHGEPTIMAMLECCEPSLVAWRVLSRVADGFMTLEENEAVRAMRRLAQPIGKDPAIVAGESGGVGLAGLMQVAGSAAERARLGLDAASRVLVINTEGATDPFVYKELVGMSPEEVLSSARRGR